MSDATVQAQFAPELSQDEKAYAGLAHALMLSTWWIAPLIIYFMKKESRFVRFHAMQALLWQIIFSVLYFAGFAVLIAVVLSSALSANGKPEPDQFPVGIFMTMPLLWLLGMGGFAISMTLAIMYSLKAMRGQWAEYPVIGKWARRIAGS
jgi:uncharacterized membrane protein